MNRIRLTAAGRGPARAAAGGLWMGSTPRSASGSAGEAETLWRLLRQLRGPSPQPARGRDVRHQGGDRRARRSAELAEAQCHGVPDRRHCRGCAGAGRRGLPRRRRNHYLSLLGPAGDRAVGRPADNRQHPSPRAGPPRPGTRSTSSRCSPPATMPRTGRCSPSTGRRRRRWSGWHCARSRSWSTRSPRARGCTHEREGGPERCE